MEQSCIRTAVRIQCEQLLHRHRLSTVLTTPVQRQNAVRLQSQLAIATIGEQQPNQCFESLQRAYLQLERVLRKLEMGPRSNQQQR